MAGLVGFTREAAGDADPAVVLRAMRRQLTHSPRQSGDRLWSDGAVYGTRTHLNASQPAPQPASDDGIYVWLDGSFNNRAELARAAGMPAATDPDLLLALYHADRDFSFLKDVDGFFAAVIYDAPRRAIHLLTDRLGLRTLYWTTYQGGLVWSSEVKAVLALPGYEPRIDPQTAREFPFFAHPLEERTWFSGVELLSSGSLLTWDMAAGARQMKRYWWWDAIQRLDRVPDVREAAEEAGRLFIRSVEQHCPDTRVNVELSGGLDSRAILAAIPAGKEVHAYTSGQRECDDIRIARRVAALRGATHHVYEIDRRNWLTETTLADLWHLDGQTSLRQLVGARAHGPALMEEAPTRLNGAGGDVLLRGFFLVDPALLDRPITRSLVEKFITWPDFRLEFGPFEALPKADYFFIHTRVRRYVMGTVRSTLDYGEVRMPFLSNALVEFVYGLPDAMRYRGALYQAMMRHYFPDYFRAIPWQRTGRPFIVPGPVERLRWLPVKASRVFWQYARKVGLTQYVNNNPRHTILDRPLWLRQEPVRSFAEHLLTNPDAIYPEYIPRADALALWERHQRGEDFANLLCNYLTAEIWFQQVFTGRYRPPATEAEAATR